MTHGGLEGEHAEEPSRAREPYASVAESLTTRLLVDPSHPRAARRRRTVHILFRVATICFIAGVATIVVAMVVAVLQG